LRLRTGYNSTTQAKISFFVFSWIEWLVKTT
jgi:hypothetical protein